MATINISLPDALYDQAKSLVARGRYTSISELIRDALRRKIDGSKITVNGFTEEFEKEVLWSEAQPMENDIVLETPEDIDKYFDSISSNKALKKRNSSAKNQNHRKVHTIAPTISR